MNDAAKGTYAFVSLGCPKNLVDSERMLGKLAQDGYALVPDADGVQLALARPKRKRGSDAAEQRSLFRPAPVKALEDTARLRITPRHYAYLKISEGCDRLCTFCAIPGMRGKHVTKPMEEIVREARELVADGVRELIVVAQDTTYYGLDLYGEVRLAHLLRELDTLEGLEWIRILYAYPVNFSDELIETIAASKKVLPYLDMPLQ